jgi:hypothetical protein
VTLKSTTAQGILLITNLIKGEQAQHGGKAWGPAGATKLGDTVLAHLM